MSSVRHTYKENPYQPKIIEEKKHENVAGALSSISHSIKSVGEKIVSASKETNKEICDIKKTFTTDMLSFGKEIFGLLYEMKGEILSRLDNIDNELNSLKAKLAEFDVVEEGPLEEKKEESDQETEMGDEIPQDWVSDDDTE